MTQGVYYFEDVLTNKFHETLHNHFLNLEFELDARPGSTHRVKNHDPHVYGIFLNVRDQLFQYLSVDDEDFRKYFDYDAGNFDLFHCLAKGPQRNDLSHYHTDNSGSCQFGMVYYPHLRWEDSWGGALCLGTELQIYPKPNSAVIFNSSIPHRINSVSIDADSWRMTIFSRTDSISNNYLSGEYLLKTTKGVFNEELIQPTQIKLE